MGQAQSSLSEFSGSKMDKTNDQSLFSEVSDSEKGKTNEMQIDDRSLASDSGAEDDRSSVTNLSICGDSAVSTVCITGIFWAR